MTSTQSVRLECGHSERNEPNSMEGLKQRKTVAWIHLILALAPTTVRNPPTMATSLVWVNPLEKRINVIFWGNKMWEDCNFISSNWTHCKPQHFLFDMEMSSEVALGSVPRPCHPQSARDHHGRMGDHLQSVMWKGIGYLATLWNRSALLACHKQQKHPPTTNMWGGLKLSRSAENDATCL